MKDTLSLHKTIKYASDMKKLEEQGRVLILPCSTNNEIYKTIMNFINDISVDTNKQLDNNGEN